MHLTYTMQEGGKAYDLGYELGRFIGAYGMYIGATLIVLIVLIIMYVKKHRQKSRNL